MIRCKSTELLSKECSHWSTLKPVKPVSFTDQIPPDIWSVDFGYLVGSFT